MKFLKSIIISIIELNKLSFYLLAKKNIIKVMSDFLSMQLIKFQYISFKLILNFMKLKFKLINKYK
jgi:hypothetical protein